MAYACLARARPGARRPLARARRSQRVLPLLLLGLLACADDPAAETADASLADADLTEDASLEPPDAAPLREVQLIDHKGWANYPAELDPLPSHQPAELRCSIVGWFPENGGLEVDTGQCNYVLIAHPAGFDVPEGSELEIEVGHFDLLAPEPATAHVALLFDADVQWETSVDIPGPGDLQRYRFRATRDLAAGEPIRLHLHNHGQNTWLIGPLLAWIP